MSNITAELHELIAFFEVDPKFQYPGDPWPYTDTLFEAQMGGLSINFAIQPAYKDVRIQMKNDGNVIYEFNGTGIEDVRYYSEKSGERLECVISDLQVISIWMKPMVRISERFTNNSE